MNSRAASAAVLSPLQTIRVISACCAGVSFGRRPPMLVLEVMRQESAFRADATSYKNGRAIAHGLMQMVRGTAGRFGVSNPYDPQQAIEGGCRYLAWLTNRYGRRRLDLILAAYNAGEGAVDRYRGSVPHYPETRNYVRRILHEYNRAIRLEATLYSRQREAR